MMDMTVNTDAVEYATVEALLSGSVEPPAAEETFDDLSLPEVEIVEAILSTHDEAEPDVIVIPTAAPRVVAERKDRVSALFADTIAADRAKEMLGDHFDLVVERMASAPKKISEKVYNGLCYLAERGKLSKFTSIAFNQLLAEERLTSAELVNLFKVNGYSEGTARSQAQQQMTVLPILQVAARDPDSKDGTTLHLYKGKLFDHFIAASERVPGEPATKTPKASKKVKSADDESLLATSPPPAYPEPEIIPETTPEVELSPVEDADLLADGPTAEIVVENVEDLLIDTADVPAVEPVKASRRDRKRGRK